MANNEVPEEKPVEKKTYEVLALEANKPLKEREAIANGRNGTKSVPRRYHMVDEKLDKIRAEIEKLGHFVSPFRKGGGSYNAIVEALVLLGENQVFDDIVVYDKFKEYLSKIPSTRKNAPIGRTTWDDWDEKDNRNADTGLDGFGRFQLNCGVLQRLGGANTYGLKLAQLGACIDILEIPGYTGDTTRFRLRLRTGIADGELVQPVKETRKREITKVSGVRAGSFRIKAVPRKTENSPVPVLPENAPKT